MVPSSHRCQRPRCALWVCLYLSLSHRRRRGLRPVPANLVHPTGSQRRSMPSRQSGLRVDRVCYGADIRGATNPNPLCCARLGCSLISSLLLLVCILHDGHRGCCQRYSRNHAVEVVTPKTFPSACRFRAVATRIICAATAKGRQLRVKRSKAEETQWTMTRFASNNGHSAFSMGTISDAP